MPWRAIQEWRYSLTSINNAYEADWAPEAVSMFWRRYKLCNTTQNQHRYLVHPACATVTILPKLSQLRYKTFLQGFDVIVSDNHYCKKKHEIHLHIQYLLNGDNFWETVITLSTYQIQYLGAKEGVKSPSKSNIYHSNHNDQLLVYSISWIGVWWTPAGNHRAAGPANVPHPIHPQPAQQSQLFHFFSRRSWSHQVSTKLPYESSWWWLLLPCPVRRWSAFPWNKK